MTKRAFSLVELILVVAILGILAAIVVPQFTTQSAAARESAAKDVLRTMRSQIELYKIQHDGTPPGYVNGGQALVAVLHLQFTGTSKLNGEAVASTIPAGDYKYGPYIKKLPENPYNGLTNIAYVALATDFSTAADGASSGWLYKKETAEFRLNWTGADSDGVNYVDY
ncbi:MAG: type II secretion system protein [Phycisphaerales bacterium]|nr:MAG: type II secretion system protein [Phycisphaerales bacterium]